MSSGTALHAERDKRAAFSAALVMHLLAFYCAWHYQGMPRTSESPTVTVSLVNLAAPSDVAGASTPKAQLVRRKTPISPASAAPKPVQVVTEAPHPTATAKARPLVSTAQAPAVPIAPPAPATKGNPASAITLSPSRKSGVAPPQATAPPALQSEELSVSCTDRTPPPYPRLSARLGEQGKTVLLVELDESGKMARVTVKTSSGFTRLDEAAVNAVKSWRCTPARQNGVAVRSFALQPFKFALKGR